MAAPDQFEYIGPAKVYIGKFAGTVAVTELAGTREVSIDFGLGSAFSTLSAQRDLPHVDGIYVLPAAPVIQVQTQDAGHENLKAIALGYTAFNAVGPPEVDAVGLPDEFQKIDAADVPGMFILPYTQDTDGVAATNGIWIPGVIPSNFNGLRMGRVQRDQEITNPASVQFRAVYRDTDWNASAIPAGARILLAGDPAAAGLAWSLS